MKRTNAYALCVILIALFTAIYFLGATPDPFAVKSEGVVFQGQGASPFAILPKLADWNSFLVSTKIGSPTDKSDLVMLNGMNLFVVVLTGNGKEVVQLFQIVDAGNNILSCETNFGDVKRRETISAGECKAMLDSNGRALVLIERPNPNLANPTVLLSEKQMVVNAKSFDDLGQTCFAALKAMFKNAEEVIGKTNAFTELLS